VSDRPVADTPENADKCLCPGCPTYKECMKAEHTALYCARGTTDCVPVREGCICPGCPVYQANGLTRQYWCFD